MPAVFKNDYLVLRCAADTAFERNLMCEKLLDVPVGLARYLHAARFRLSIFHRFHDASRPHLVGLKRVKPVVKELIVLDQIPRGGTSRRSDVHSLVYLTVYTQSHFNRREILELPEADSIGSRHRIRYERAFLQNEIFEIIGDSFL